jgi:UPF0755 protein
MTDLLTEQAGPSDEDRRSAAASRRGCLAALLGLAVIAVVIWLVGARLIGFVEDQFGSGEDEDFAGPGKGQVTVSVPEGASGADIGAVLEERGVIADASFFADLAAEDPDGATIQPGDYEMPKELPSKDALRLLIDGRNRVSYAVTFPEGLTVKEILDQLAEETDISRKALSRAAQQPEKLDLPSYANGNLEGYLFPAQYELPPGTTATEALAMMVDRFRTVVEDAGVEQRARDLGVRPHDLVTIASLVQAEAPAGAFDKVARVIYNREQEQMALQFDSTVHYALGDTGGDPFTTDEERRVDSPYNTYLYPGLPPGAIGAPGEDALEAALSPARGDWLYFVTVNLETGETLFADGLRKHNANVRKLQEYCRTAEC